jgi:hypothetical protein
MTSSTRSPNPDAAAVARHLAVVGRSATGQPRTFRVELAGHTNRPGRAAAYRRLAAVILGLDVPTLAFRLRAVRTRQLTAA